MNLKHYEAWYLRGTPGEAFTYHVGKTGDVRGARLCSPVRRTTQETLLTEVADRAMRDWESGNVHLLQRRQDGGLFAWFAVRA